ncbi:metal-dependent hydrolase [Microbacterium sp. ET2]|uniref:metal-dependent hydrolase n=1 Tax=Microbacterium albipurpureum TaxID=3050384 RepID=UPI00259CD721|nr:metal-dependent hydrolase [Microbacterium sp. ET2 (Ac-2212)]WJL94258.1 metal-dependent hydrolase [Microbacterium sp. ET2 (Ac-2212)]
MPEPHATLPVPAGLPETDTVVTYPQGATSSTGRVLHVEDLGDGRSAVLLDVTCVHPVTAAWPDQPADRATLEAAGTTFAVVDAVVGGVQDGRLFLGADLPVRMGTEGWVFVVAHIVEGDGPAAGTEVRAVVDAEYRVALSAGHTVCHLASLALNAALAQAWIKEVMPDARGNPNFDALAIETSRIHPGGSVDVYRIGKSLRRKGFVATALDDLDAVASHANMLLAEWVGSGAAVRIERDGDALSSRRAWVCQLPDMTVHIPCGGTHASRLGDFASVSVALEARDVEGAREITMTTTGRAAP